MREKECKLCGKRSKIISESIGVCIECLREKPEEALIYAEETHRRSREKFGLPPSPPRSEDGIRCGLCDADCAIGEGGRGYCGLRKNVGGKLESPVNERKALLHYYLDAHVTNCLLGDAIVLLHDGAAVRIEDLIDKLDGKVKMLSYRGWRFAEEDVIHKQKFRYRGRLVKLRTESGLEISVTPDHCFLADGKIPTYIPASELRPGDRIFTYLGNGVRHPEKDLSIADFLPEDISIYDQSVKKLLKELVSRGILAGKSFDKLKELIYDRRRGVKLGLLRRLCAESPLGWKRILSIIKTVGYKKRIILRKKELTPQHMYLLGLLYSDGHVRQKTNLITFSNTSKTLIRKVKKIYEDLFGNTRLRTYWRKTAIKAGKSKIIKKRRVLVLEDTNPVLKSLYNKLVLDHLRLPFNMAWLDEKLVAGFLAGLLDGDGCVSLRGRCVEIGFVLKCSEHAKGILLLLRSLGIVGRLFKMNGSKVYRVIVKSSRSCEKLARLLSRYSILKRRKLEKLLRRVEEFNKRGDIDEKLPLFFSTVVHEITVRYKLAKSRIGNPITLTRYESFLRNPSREQAKKIIENLFRIIGEDPLLNGLKMLLDCEVIPEKITEIEYIDYDGFVYDVTLKNSHNFIANGVLVKNCCAAWFCPAGTGAGYPSYAVRNGPEYGYYNLALFFYGCSFDCLFCQNWSHKRLRDGRLTSVDEPVEYSLKDNRITCWCWFGGSPEPQLPFALNASRRILEEKRERRILRICFEWNGCGAKGLVKKAGELAYVSGGNIKFDLKAYTQSVHRALTGRDNKRVLENFELIYREFYERRREVPVLNATTLLVPHYVDEYEVSRIAEFIASLDPEIPYSLLIFHPDYLMSDVTVTPRKQVERCYQAAKRYLKNVNIGNIALLGLAEAEA